MSDTYIDAAGVCAKCRERLTLREFDREAGRGILECRSCDTKFVVAVQGRKRDPKHNQDVACGHEGCGHPYARHFDGFDDDVEVGCKYCECRTFVEPIPPPVSDEAYGAWVREHYRHIDQCGEEAYSKLLHRFRHDFGPNQVLAKSVDPEHRPAAAAFQYLSEEEQSSVVGRHVLGEDGYRIYLEEMEAFFERGDY